MDTVSFLMLVGYSNTYGGKKAVHKFLIDPHLIIMPRGFVKTSSLLNFLNLYFSQPAVIAMQFRVQNTLIVHLIQTK